MLYIPIKKALYPIQYSNILLRRTSPKTSLSLLSYSQVHQQMQGIGQYEAIRLLTNEMGLALNKDAKDTLSKASMAEFKSANDGLKTGQCTLLKAC